MTWEDCDLYVVIMSDAVGYGDMCGPDSMAGYAGWGEGSDVETIEADSAVVSGYVRMYRVASSVASSFSGDKYLRLSSCPRSWSGSGGSSSSGGPDGSWGGGMAVMVWVVTVIMMVWMAASSSSSSPESGPGYAVSADLDSDVDMVACGSGSEEVATDEGVEGS